jgi:hypothetical protein
VAIFPKGASVRVDGVERTLDSGDLILEGEAEDSFVVEVQSGTGRVRERVKLLADGSASPTRVGHDVGVERRAAARARTQAGKTPTPEPPPATAGTSAVTASSGKPPSAPSGDVQFRRSWGD